MQVNGAGFSLSTSYASNTDMNLQEKINASIQQDRMDKMYGKAEKEAKNSYSAPSPEGTGRFVDTLA